MLLSFFCRKRIEGRPAGSLRSSAAFWRNCVWITFNWYEYSSVYTEFLCDEFLYNEILCDYVNTKTELLVAAILVKTFGVTGMVQVFAGFLQRYPCTGLVKCLLGTIPTGYLVTAVWCDVLGCLLQWCNRPYVISRSE